MVKKFNEFNQTNEGLIDDVWSKTKHVIAKAGSITQGGNLLGRSDAKNKANQELDTILNDVANSAIKALKAEIKEIDEEFPNNEKREDFLKCLTLIEQYYITIIFTSLCNTYGVKQPSKAETSKEGWKQDFLNYSKLKVDKNGNYITIIKEDDPNYMTIDQANALIENLQKYVKKIIDYDLSTSYTVFERNYNFEDEDEDYITEGITDKIRNIFKSKNKQELTSGHNTHTKDMVNSTKWEKIIGALGLALGVFGWVTQTEWFKLLLEKWLNQGDIVTQDIKDIAFEIKNGDGITQALNKTFGTNFTAATPKAEMIAKLKEMGFGNNAFEIAKNLGLESASPNSGIAQDFATALSGEGTIGQGFKGLFHGKVGTLLQVNPGTYLAKQIGPIIVKQGVKWGTIIAAKAAGIGAIALPLGAALVAGAATSWIAKLKARSSSRYKNLQDLLEGLFLIPTNPGTEVVLTNDQQVKDKDVENIKTDKKEIFKLILSNLRYLDGCIQTVDSIGVEGEKGKKITISKNEKYLNQSFIKIKNTIKSLVNVKDKGVAIDTSFINSIIKTNAEKQEDGKVKNADNVLLIKNIYLEIFEHIYGNKKNEIVLDKLYENKIDINIENAGRKFALFTKRALQFEKEGFYQGLGEFGKKLQLFNSTMIEILNIIKQDPDVLNVKVVKHVEYDIQSKTKNNYNDPKFKQKYIDRRNKK